MDDPQLEEKKAKAKLYAQESERFRLLGVHLTMASEHGERELSLVEGTWRCTCAFYHQRGTCSHIMAAEAIFRSLKIYGDNVIP